MQDEHKTNQDESKSEHCQSELLKVTGAVPSRIPTVASQPHENESPKKQKKSEYIMRPIVAIWRGIKVSLSFLDRHHGSITAIATVAIVCLTFVYVQYSKRQWRVAQDSLSISQRAYVTIGKKDGVIGDFIVPKDPKQDAEIVIYFTNGGHLPAKFAWGTMAGFLAAGSTGSSTGITYTHPYKGGLSYRTRDKKTGSLGQKGDDSTIIPGDSVFVSTLGTISQKALDQLPQNHMGLLITGMFDYCDELGDRSTQQFSLTYRSNAPVSNMSFALIEQNDWFLFPLPEPTATTEFLPPCETSSEREQQVQKQKHKWWAALSWPK